MKARASSLLPLLMCSLPMVLCACEGVLDEGELEQELPGELSLWPGTTVPAQPSVADDQAVELGLKFRSSAAGRVTGMRFYKGTGNRGPHVGNLWTAAGARLATVTFATESRTGWQRARFASPVRLVPGDTYVVSYHAPRGRYAAEDEGLLASGRQAGPLYALKSGEAGGNGVYRYGGSGFPSLTYRASNYFVDVLFIADASAPDAGAPNPGAPDAGPGPSPADNTPPSVPQGLTARAASSTQVNLSWTAAADDARVARYLVLRNGNQVGATDGTTYADTGLAPSSMYVYSVKAVDAAGNVSAASANAAATTLGAPSVDCVRGVWRNLEACGWPGPANTGVPAGVTLRTTSARTVSTDNTVIDGERIDGGLVIAARNVTVRNSFISKFLATGTAANGSGVIKILPGASATLEHNTLDGRQGVHACIWAEGTNVVARFNNCFNVNDGVFIWDTDNFTVENNYLHDFTDQTANGHIDGFQTEGASHGVIRHNTFDVSQAQDACVAIWNGRRSSDDILVDDNLMAGGGFAVYAEDYSPSEASPAGGFTVTNIRFTNNRFSTVHAGCVGGYGVWFPRGSPSDGWRRTGNVVLETNQSVDNGNPTFDGRVCN